MTQNRIVKHSRRKLLRKGNQESHKKAATSLLRPIFVIALIGIFGLTLALSSGRMSAASGSPQSKPEATMSEEAARQIQALVDEKESRTPAQQKIDSQLIYLTKTARRQPIALGVSSLEIGAKVEDDGKTVVDIRIANDTNVKALVPLLQQNGAEIINAIGNNIRARVAVEDLEALAALSAVRFIMPRQDAKVYSDRSQIGGIRPLTNLGLASGASVSRTERLAKVRSQLLTALSSSSKSAKTAQKSVNPGQTGPNKTALVNTSEGDKTHKADVGRASFGINGTGIKVGVLSDGVTNLAAAQASGDLPAGVTVLPGQTGSGDEGTAMLEIVHDLAPGAQLFFATAFTSITSFAQNIRDLRTAGCDIIVDDVIYFVETPMQDGQAPAVVSLTNGGVVAQAVNDVTAAGAMYFSSAGNEGGVDRASASVWEGDFVDGGASPVAAITGGTVHNFGGGNLNDQITQAGARSLLFWSDPLGASSNDYDLFVLNSAGTAVAASSTNIQNGTQDPVEDAGNRTSGQRLVILKKTGAAARFLHLTCFGAEMAFTTSGTTHGHNAGALAFSVAATPADDAFCAGDVDGPFPGPFTATNKNECFSSDGPRRLLYNANSTPITPGNVSSTGGVLRQKPDITAADGVAVTGVGGFPNPFYGTSASAPHAGAIAALVKSAVPGITNAQVRTALVSSAIDIEAAGVDRNSGAGIIMAFEALQAAGAVPQAVIVSAGATLVSESCTPANGALDPNELVTVSFCVQNTGALNTTALTGTLQATGGVTSPSGPQNYGVVVAGGPPVCRNFTFTATGTCGGTVTASIHFQDGATDLGTVTYTFSLGVLNTAFSENFDGVTAPALPAGWVSATTAGPATCTPTGTCALATNWTTVSTTNDTAPNSAFHNDPSCVTDSTLDTPSISITSASSQVTFRNSFNVENTFDGAVLEISIGGGAFADIVTAGGSFVTGGYNGTISVNFLSPIAGRMAWTGNSSGFITTTANLPAAANGQNIKLRFRMASDCSLGVTGWNIDTVRVTSGFTCSTCAAAACTLTCPANITKSNDPNQCGAVVTYPAPTTTGTCGTVTCTPASGSFFPKGTTTVTCSSPAPASCSFTVTVNDTQPPVITCPPNQTAVTTTVTNPCAVVNYTATASDNCPGVTVVCNPPSGSCFPVGTTTVTCTATDGSGNTATCTFTVSVFNGRLQDDSGGCNNTVLFNTITGDYRWCCGGTIFTGKGKVTTLGSTYTIEHNATDRRVLIKLSAGTTPPSGTGSLQSPVGTNRCIITDRDTRNDTCACGAPAAPAMK